MLPLKNKSLSQDVALEVIGKLAYYLNNLYLYERGSAGIALWEINGLLKTQFGITVGQINMGGNLDIPFDVYAHLTTDVNAYTAEFKRVLLLKIHPENSASNVFS